MRGPSLLRDSRSPKAGHNKAGRSDFEISDSDPIAKCGKCGSPLSPQKRRFHRAKTRKHGKCGHESAENAENAADWL